MRAVCGLDSKKSERLDQSCVDYCFQLRDPSQHDGERFLPTFWRVLGLVVRDTAYPDKMSLLEARSFFFERSKLGEDGGYSSRWVKVESKPFPFYFPNWPARVAAARLHDLHHIAADYATDWPGEIEIAAWEIASGCGRYSAAWILDLAAFNIALLVAPRRFFRAFARGRRAPTNLYSQPLAEYQLAQTTLGQLRDQLGLRTPIPAIEPRDIGLGLFWCAVAILLYEGPAVIAGIFLWRWLFR